MSGDIFMGLNEDSETEDEQQGIYGTPVEYSGVSGSGASSPTKSQQQPRPEPEPKPGPSSAPQAQQEPPLQNGVYLCPAPNCKKSYKTLRGFYKHQLDKHPPEDIEMEPLPQPTQCQTDTPEVFHCTKCKSTFKTKQGLARHQAVHRFEEISGRKPQPADFKPFEMEVANKILTLPQQFFPQAKIEEKRNVTMLPHPLSIM